MQLLCETEDLKQILKTLFKKHKRIYIASAWASAGTAEFELLKANRNKIKSLIIGTHFYQSDPDFLEEFKNQGKFVLNPSGVFHPKVYFFASSKEDWDCIVGSSNFTNGGLGVNTEMSVHLRSDPKSKWSSESYEQLLSQFKAYEALADEEFDLAAYKSVWERMRLKRASLLGIYSAKSKNRKGKKQILEVPMLNMPWAEFERQVIRDKHHSIDLRLHVLDEARSSFLENAEFKLIDLKRRQEIAGFGSNSKEMWGFFGSYVGAGKFKNRINKNDPWLSDALSQIPLSGAVSKNGFQRFVQSFKKAFPNGRHGIGSASRLLAMKRPDYFVCYNRGNKTLLCKAFGVAQLFTGDYERYWDDIIERIMDSTWWTAPRPVTKRGGAIWDGRSALLDSLFYDSSIHD